MSTGFDDELLFDELNDILDIDMTDFGFDIDKIDLFKENERHKTNDAYNRNTKSFSGFKRTIPDRISLSETGSMICRLQKNTGCPPLPAVTGMAGRMNSAEQVK